MFLKSYDFSAPMNHVIEWNAIARNGKHDFNQDVIDFQITLVEEESQELEEAIETSNKVLALDGLCDMFVTGAYWYFLENKSVAGGFNILPPLKGLDYVLAAKTDLKNRSSYMFMASVCSMLQLFNGNSEDALLEVLASNDSKYPLVKGHEGSPEDMCIWIEDEYKGKHTGVTYKIVKDSKGDKRYVFFNDKGKIVKPKSFFEPNLKQFC